ncbi:hypothetical protein VNO80_19302 [Phaseolus coccineus]|uniref:Uncharacterized protein n=1 Tax=Phaseolus coccineus TaxID=3886 RepID=A0AAN9MFW6_PHACN
MCRRASPGRARYADIARAREACGHRRGARGMRASPGIDIGHTIQECNKVCDLIEEFIRSGALNVLSRTTTLTKVEETEDGEVEAEVFEKDIKARAKEYQPQQGKLFILLKLHRNKKNQAL